MSIVFKKATREAVQCIISIAGGTGSGKTWSSMTLAKGLAGGKRFAVLDSERGRARHYSDAFDFDTAELHAPFTPARYLEMILAADDAGYPVIVIDQMSAEWAGDGGCLDMHEAEVNRLGGDDWKKREAVKMVAWASVKGEHKRMMQKLLQVKAHLVIALRAEEKIDIIREEGKTKIVKKESVVGLDGWIPIAEKTMPYEMTASFLMTADAPGIPKPIKLPEQFKPFFPLDRQLTEDAGKMLADWSRGNSPLDRLRAAAGKGTKAMLEVWEKLPKPQQHALRAEKDALKATAASVDAKASTGPAEAPRSEARVAPSQTAAAEPSGEPATGSGALALDYPVPPKGTAEACEWMERMKGAKNQVEANAIYAAAVEAVDGGLHAERLLVDLTALKPDFTS